MNTAITTYLTGAFEKYRSGFLTMPDIAPELEGFKPLVQQLNYKDHITPIYEELKDNIARHWPAPDEEQYVILFNYDDMSQKDAEAEAYVINVCRPVYPVQAEPHNTHVFYDFAKEGYALPAFKASSYAPLQQLNKRFFDEDGNTVYVSNYKGWWELKKVYQYIVYLALQEALTTLYSDKVFARFKMVRDFQFIIGEHDCELQPLLIIP